MELVCVRTMKTASTMSWCLSGCTSQDFPRRTCRRTWRRRRTSSQWKLDGTLLIVLSATDSIFEHISYTYEKWAVPQRKKIASHSQPPPKRFWAMTKAVKTKHISRKTPQNRIYSTFQLAYTKYNIPSSPVVRQCMLQLSSWKLLSKTHVGRKKVE